MLGGMAQLQLHRQHTLCLIRGQREPRRRLSITTTCAWGRGGSHKQPSVAVPPPQPPPPSVTQRSLVWVAVGVAGLTIAAAAFSIVRKFSGASNARVTRPGPPLTAEELAEVAAMGPLLAAAETAAAVDDTARLSPAELQDLETNVRMLITSMDAQLVELRDALAASLPEAAAQALDAAGDEVAAAEERLASAAGRAGPTADAAAVELERQLTAAEFEAFGILAPYASDADRRSFRSLLYNRSVQRRLLGQVERQLALRQQMAAVEKQLDTLRAAQQRTQEKAEALQAAQQQQQEAAAVAAAAAAAAEKATDTNASIAAEAWAQVQQDYNIVPEADAEPDTTEPVEISLPGGVSVSEGLRLSAAGACVPHPAKAATGGEDAHFVNAAQGCFAVADGVSGWAASGIDPSEYPRLLIAACEEAAADDLKDPLAMLERAYEAAHAPGSCTVAVACLEGATLRVASLGDCGVRVVRGGAVAFASAVQEHQFNQPLQLASPRHHDTGSRPANARQYNVSVLPGDVVVMGSDGLWDNVWDAEVLELVGKTRLAARASNGDSSAEVLAAAAADLADALAALAAAHGGNHFRCSPFAAEKQALRMPALFKSFAPPALGGKLDDVTVVVAVVHPA